MSKNKVEIVGVDTSKLKNLDKDTFKIMKYGLFFCTCLIGW